MITHQNLSDEDFESQFKDASLSPSLFSHEAHLRLAFIHIKKYGVDKAATNICEQIERFDETHGDGTKFNKTVTVAAVKMVNHFINRASKDTFNDLTNRFPKMLNSFSDLMAHHYSINIFSNEYAKQNYVEPDLVEF